MKKISVLLVLAFFVIFSAAMFAADLLDVVYLKTGAVIKGVITEEIPGVSVKIETSDGNVFVYKESEISKTGKETAKTAAKARTKPKVIIPEKDNAFIFNPVGFLFFGPQFEYERRINDDLYFSGIIRFQSLGLFTGEAFRGTDLLSGSAGIGIKYFIRGQDSPGGLYFGAQGQVGYYTIKVTEHNIVSAYILDIVPLGEAGYRWRMDNGLIISLGLLAGASVQVMAVYYETANPDVALNDTLDSPLMIGMAELSIGWEF
jgi:hypothetical protein